MPVTHSNPSLSLQPRRRFSPRQLAKAEDAEQKQFALRRVVALLGTRLSPELLQKLISDLDLIGDTATLMAALRKRLRAKPAPDVVGAVHPDPDLWRAGRVR
jgi:hypothetical protein